MRIMPALSLWGLDTWRVTERIRQERGDLQLSVACIGMAGENEVRLANIIGE